MAPNMSSNSVTPSTEQLSHQNKLQGEIHALKTVISVLIAHIAIISRSPIEKREEILHTISSMLPSALAYIEHDSPNDAAAGFEQAIESINYLARTAIRIDPVAPGQPRKKTTD